MLFRYDKEHIPYNLAFDNCSFSQLIFASEEETATTTTYAKVQSTVTLTSGYFQIETYKPVVSTNYLPLWCLGNPQTSS